MPTPHVRDWIDYLQALAPSIAALIALGVGLTQWRLQRENLKQQLFEKRLKVFNSVELFIAKIVATNGDISIPDYQNFRRDTHVAEFLFGSQVLDHIKEIDSEGAGLRRANTLLKHYQGIVSNSVYLDGLPRDNHQAFAKVTELNKEIR